MAVNSLLGWLRHTFSTSHEGRISSIKGLGIVSLQGNVQLFYTSNADPHKILSAKSHDGVAFEFVEEIHFLPDHYTNLLQQLRFYKSERELRAQYKLLHQPTWHPVVTKDLQSFHAVMDNAAVEPIVEVLDKEKGEYIRYTGDHNIFSYAISKDGHTWTDEKLALTSRRGSFDDGSLTPELSFKVEEGIMLVYSSRKKIDGIATYTVGAALFDALDPWRLIWRSEKPLWDQQVEWKDKNVSPIGVILFNQHIFMYVQVEGEGVHVILLPSIALVHHMRYHTPITKLHRYDKNPLIAPSQHNAWEAFNTFNAAALYADEKFHLVYRAQGHDYVSVLGYASSKDGLHIDEKLSEPIYYPREHFEEVIEKPAALSYQYMSAGYGGSEDPRLTLIDGRVYMTYVAFDGVNPPRVALTSIELEKFLSRNWQWERSVLISPPGIVDKNAVIFPEKIHGKYVIMHRIFPDILIDFVDTLKFNGTWWLEGHYKISPRPDKWDSRKIGAGPPPLKTADGWLLIYQAVGNQDAGRYKIGAMLLDLHDPTKVLYRSKNPILEPEAWYENEGFKAGVVYPCGAVIKDGILFVYYGGADSHVCVATAVVEELVDHLKREEEISLKPAILSLNMLNI